MKTAGYLLEEWARWCRHDPLPMDWPHATSFGKLIKPDPRPATEPIDVLRAAATDRVVARLPGRVRFLINLHYLDTGPIDAKARRLRMRRQRYLDLIDGVCRVVALRIDSGTRNC